MVKKKAKGAKFAGRGRTAKAKFLCTAKLRNGNPCPKNAELGKVLCRWHDPEDETWRDLYIKLDKISSEEKTNLVLELIEDNPEHILSLPLRDGLFANLRDVDLGRETLEQKKKLLGSEEALWWHSEYMGINLTFANLHYADLTGANLQGAFLSNANLQEITLDNVNLQGANLQSANLQNAKLKEADLENANLCNANLSFAYLEKANLKSARLLASNLQSAKLIAASLQEADLMGANLHEAYLNQAKLQKAHLEESDLLMAHLGRADLSGAFLYAACLRKADLRMANLYNTQLDGVDLQGANLHLAALDQASLKDAKLQGLDLTYLRNMSNVFLMNAWLDRTRLRHKQLGNAIGEELVQDYSAAKNGYLLLKQNFDDLGDYEAASWAYRKERRMEKLEALGNGNFVKFIGDSIVELLCDYGESFWRVVVWMAVLLLLVGPLLFSSLGGIEWSVELKKEYFELSSFARFGFWYRTYLLYTLDTLTTASFSGLQPINDAVKFASGFFAIIGIFLAGLLGFVAGNRIRRS